jgi:hypothetical protein
MSNETILERFWSKVDRRGPDDCWPWKGYVDVKGNGYGQFWDGMHLVKSHRFAYILTNGFIAPGLVADHTCHNDADCTDVPCQHRACCNPGHLEAVTQSVNSIRGHSGDHQSTKACCPKSHPYSLENTLIRSNGRQRVCRECNRQSQARYRAKRKENSLCQTNK